VGVGKKGNWQEIVDSWQEAKKPVGKVYFLEKNNNCNNQT
jgi:hypothetical protein